MLLVCSYIVDPFNNIITYADHVPFCIITLKFDAMLKGYTYVLTVHVYQIARVRYSKQEVCTHSKKKCVKIICFVYTTPPVSVWMPSSRRWLYSAPEQL